MYTVYEHRGHGHLLSLATPLTVSKVGKHFML